MTEDLGALYQNYLEALNDRRLNEMHRFAHDELVFNGEHVTRDEYVSAIAAHLE